MGTIHIRAVIGGFIVATLDDMDEDAEEEAVFTTVDGALAYTRAQLLDLPDAPETPPTDPN